MRMKKSVCLFGILSLWMAMSVSAQSVKQQEATMEDYLPLLQASGYKVYSFDISEFADESYLLTFKVKEYTDSIKGKEVGKFKVSNRSMIHEFSEESQRRILAKGTAVDVEKGIYRLGTKLYVSFRPGNTDSTKVVHMGVDGMGESARMLNLKSLKFPKSDRVDYCYESRPFILDKFEEGKFIPLVFFASFWVDEKYGFLRFCGAQEISSTMESDYIENTPHFYVIGVEIQKMSAK